MAVADLQISTPERGRRGSGNPLIIVIAGLLLVVVVLCVLLALRPRSQQLNGGGVVVGGNVQGNVTVQVNIEQLQQIANRQLEVAKRLEQSQKQNEELIKKYDQLAGEFKSLRDSIEKHDSVLTQAQRREVNESVAIAEQAKRIRSASNLRQLGLAMMMYANQEVRNGSSVLRFSLGDLATLLDLEPEVFVSPRDPDPPPVDKSNRDAVKAWVEKYSSYALVSSHESEATLDAQYIIAYEKIAPSKETIPVLYADAHVEDLPTEALTAELKKQKAGPPVAVSR